MRIQHIEFRIGQQYETQDLIKTAFDNLMKNGLSNINSIRIENRVSALSDQWEKFSNNHEAISIAINQLESDEKDKILQHDYFKTKLYQVTYEMFLDSSEQMKGLLNDNSQRFQRSSSTLSLSQCSNNQSIIHRGPRLPRIDLPKFDGTSSDWLSFKDLFESLVLSNSSLSSVEKLQYLKTSLVGSASPLLKNTTLTSDNFQKSWDALISFYENKRLLVNSALHSLLTLKRMVKESASEIETLYTTIMQIYRTLETLNRPVHAWDDFFVFIAVQRLDSESVKSWEHHLGSSKEPPNWKQFSEFLMTRMLSLQAFEKSRHGKTQLQSFNQPMRTHFASQQEKHQSLNSKGCPFCSEIHYAATCSTYINKTVDQKYALVTKHNLCYNCLGYHRSSNCSSNKRCSKCGKKHHSSLHRAQVTTTNTSISNADSSQAQANFAKIQDFTFPSCTLLATAQVVVSSCAGEKIQARALIDPGSQISFISERLIQTLHIVRSKSSTFLNGIGAVKAGRTKGIASIILSPHFVSRIKCEMRVNILPKLTATIPSIHIDKNQNWPQLKGLTLADPEFFVPGRIDILIGADYYGQIIEEGLKKGVKNSPIAQKTIFGWVVSGPQSSSPESRTNQGFHSSIDQELYDLLQRFWLLEEIPLSNHSKLSSDDQECEDHFQKTHYRDSDGRYVVRLPIKQSLGNLGHSRNQALKFLLSLERRFKGNPTFYNAYSAFLQEYESLNHMQQVHISEPEPIHSYYLPHHGVIRETSITTKLRVVFNGSCRTSSGISLNDILHTGAKLQTDLYDVLLWFRQHRYVFSSDVEKMYRQIKVHPDDVDLQRILWITEQGDIQTYRLTTVTYGLSCAPFLALRSILQLVNDEGERFPLAIPSLTKGRYVDDIFGGSDTIEKAQEIARQTNELCMAGGFPLQKWISNESRVIENIPTNQHRNQPSLVINENTTVQALGICWNPTSDTFQFNLTLTKPPKITKRAILSTIAQIFDPLGFLTPVTIRAKVFMQDLWSIKLNWDDELPLNLQTKWTEIFNDIQKLPELSFPRWLEITKNSSIELHGFCDASQSAVASVVYIRSTIDESINTVLICSKTKVAPLKRLTIPRLELLGAVILTKLVVHVLKVLQFDSIPVVLWTDSAIVHTWINNHPSKWKEFVHNRVCYIQESLPHAKWNFIAGKENPADSSTRGLTTSQLSEHRIWWNGPDWLKKPSSSWPQQSTVPPIQNNLEERSVQCTTSINTMMPIWEIVTKYSTLKRLLRITAICQRVISRFKKCYASSLVNPITPEDITQAKNYWIKQIQSAYFHDEIKTLSKGKQFQKSHPFSRLTPYLDKYGYLRVGGRLQSSVLSENSKHPLIIPRDSIFTKLIIDDAHSRTLHGGTQSTLSYIRDTFWIIGGRAPVRSFILKCVKCTRYRNQRSEQLMGQLPPFRVNPSRPFYNSGVDYAGPLNLKTWRGRSARTYKAYIALFVCHSTSAIHLELVTDYTSEAFIAAYKRFTARRGICSTLRSDCGSNLKGADIELQSLFSAASNQSKTIANLLANDGTKWIFNPPAAPHFGGKWEAGVKSLKFHLRRVIGDRLLTYEEMNTLLTQIEVILNSRPLCPLTNDSEDLFALTPGHFLIGNNPSVIPEPSLETEKVSRLSKWQSIRQMIDLFWSKWSKECLQRYQAIYKWTQSSFPFKIGSLVLIVDERYPPSKWPLGRIIELHPGKDGLTRVVTVKTQTTTLKRPIVKLCLLPIDTDTL